MLFLRTNKYVKVKKCRDEEYFVMAFLLTYILTILKIMGKM